MKEEFIYFYKRELGVWNMVYKYMNKLLLITYVVVFLLLFLALTLVLFAQNVIHIVIVFALIIILGVILNNHNKIIIEKRYHILKKDQGKIWGGPKFLQIRSERLERFVLKKIDSQDQLEKLISVLGKEAENRKFSGIFIRGLGIGLFLPLWNYFIKWIFENQVGNVNSAIILFITIFFLIILIIFYTSIVKLIVKDFFDRDSTRIIELANMLEDISLKQLNFNNKISKWESSN